MATKVVRYECRHCDKAFGRSEHRKRHELIHTKSKLLPCPECTKSFIRTDALRRHQLTHQASSNNDIGFGRACFNCAEAKIKCSRHDTCRRCAQRELQCLYPEPQQGSSPRRKRGSSASGPMENGTFRAFRLPSITNNPALVDDNDSTSPQSQATHTTADTGGSAGVTWHMNPIVRSIPEHSISPNTGEGESVDMREGSEEPAPSPARRSFAVSLNSFIPQTLQSIEKWRALADSIQWTHPRHRDPIRAHRDSVSSTPGFSLQDFDAAHGMALVEDYLKNAHVLNPIFEQADIQALAQETFATGFGWDARSCLVLLVTAIGATSMPYVPNALHSRPIDENLAQNLFHAAVQRLGFAFADSNLIQAQIFFLTGVYYMCRLQPFEAWRAFHSAVAACQNFHCVVTMGASKTPTPTRLSNEEAVYWSSWKSESELRWELGLRDFDSRAISYPIFGSPMPPDSNDGMTIDSWFFYLSEISLWRLHFTSEKTLHELALDPDEQRLVRLASHFDSYECQVVSWQHSLAPPVKLPQLDSPDVLLDDSLVKYRLSGQVGNFYELITWPFVDAVINSDDNQPESIRALAAKGLHWHAARLRCYRPGFCHRHHGTWLIQRRATRSALVLLAASLTSSARNLLPLEWETGVSDTIQVLTYWANKISDAAHYARLLTALQQRSNELKTAAVSNDHHP